MIEGWYGERTPVWGRQAYSTRSQQAEECTYENDQFRGAF